MVKDVRGTVDVSPKIAVKCNLLSRKLEGFDVPPGKDYLSSRVPVMFNSDVCLELASPLRLSAKTFTRTQMKTRWYSFTTAQNTPHHVRKDHFPQGDLSSYSQRVQFISLNSITTTTDF